MLGLGNSCYGWDKSCFDPPDPCGPGPMSSQPVPVCAPTVTWFWLLAGGLAAALIVARFK